MKSLMTAVVTALCFVHFANPSDGSKMYVLNEDGPQFGATDGEDGFARDAQGNKLPIGVKVFGAGSAEFRKAEAAIQNIRIKAGRRTVTGESLREDATTKLARCTSEFVNFGYAVKEGLPEQVVTAATDFDTRVRVCSAFYEDLRFAALREQVEKEQNDLGNFTPTASAT